MTLRDRLPAGAAVAGAFLLLVPLAFLTGCGPKEEEQTPTASGGVAPAPGATPQAMPSLPPEVQVGPPK